MPEKINSIEELERLKADAASQGLQIPNYNEWAQALETLELAGVQSTGSYSGDAAKAREIENAVEELMRQAQEARAAEQNNKETQQVEGLTKTDSEQTVKANMANATSSMIMADYMNYYHLLS